MRAPTARQHLLAVHGRDSQQLTDFEVNQLAVVLLAELISNKRKEVTYANDYSRYKGPERS
jgi:hypothetical protein